MLTAADCPSSERNDQQFPFFKVLIIVVAQEPMHYDLYTYSSSGELGWKVCSSNAAEAGHAQSRSRSSSTMLPSAMAMRTGSFAAHQAPTLFAVVPRQARSSQQM
jgi:hypothetical protein